MKKILVFFALLLFLLFFRTDVRAAACASCTKANCCEDACGSGYHCSGNTSQGCGCAVNTPTTKPANTPTPADSGCDACTSNNCCGDWCPEYGSNYSCSGNTNNGCSCKASSSTNTPTKAPTKTPTSTPTGSAPGATNTPSGDSCAGACASNISCVSGATKQVTCQTQGSCGTGGCGPGEQTCTVTCTRNSPSGCDPVECDTYCTADPSCGASSCDEVVEVDGGCGEGGCSAVKRLIGTRVCHNPETEGPVCADDPACGGVTATSAPTNTPGGSGNTPTNTPTSVSQGTVRARAVIVSPDDTSCAAINASTSFLGGTTFTITGKSPQTQNGGAYVSWANVNAGGYLLSASFPGDYGLARGCWSRTATSPSSGTGMSSSFSASGETLTWNVGAVPPGAWVQTRGGDVYSGTFVQSLIPSSAQPSRHFSLGGAGGYPGVVRYGTSFDFQSDSGLGESFVSLLNWNVNTTDRYVVNYYDLFWRKFGGPTTPDLGADDLVSPLAQPVSRETPYYAVGDVTTSGNWVVPDGETLTMLIDGDLTISGTITTTGTGFVAFIVNGNITVDPSVGTTFSSTTPVLEGVYITSPTGTFSTGLSSVPGEERFVGQGIFVAGAFALQRDLESFGGNANYAAEYFIYDPSLLVSMPDSMKDAAVSWTEVAP